MYFAQNLKFLRVQKGLTQIQLEKELDIKRATLSNYEVGTREPDINTLCQIAKYFEISLDELITMQLCKDLPQYVRNIKFLRKKNGFTQSEIAELLGYRGKQGYGAGETGNAGNLVDNLIKLTDYFGVTLD